MRPLAEDIEQQLETALVAQYASGEATKSIATRVGVSLSTVRKVRQKLERAGVLERVSPYKWKPVGNVPNVPTDFSSPTELARYLPQMSILGAEDRMRYLSHLVLHGPDTVKVAATRALDEAERSWHSRRAASAALPKNDEERLARLALVRQSVGPALFARACGCADLRSESAARTHPEEEPDVFATAPAD